MSVWTASYGGGKTATVLRLSTVAVRQGWRILYVVPNNHVGAKGVRDFSRNGLSVDGSLLTIDEAENVAIPSLQRSAAVVISTADSVLRGGSGSKGFSAIYGQFDLVILEEAEAMTFASSFPAMVTLRPGGRVLAIGDPMQNKPTLFGTIAKASKALTPMDLLGALFFTVRSLNSAWKMLVQ